MSLIHRQLGISVVLYLLALAIWGFGAYVLRRDLGPSFRSTLVIGEVMLIAQAALGVILLLQGAMPGQLLHLAYGVFATVGIPIAASYLTGSTGRRRTLIYAIALLVIFGLAVRAYMTGLRG